MADGTCTRRATFWKRWLPGAALAGTLAMAWLAWEGALGPTGVLASGQFQQTPAPANGPSRPGPLAESPNRPSQPLSVDEGLADTSGNRLPPSGPVEVLVELVDPPAARVYAIARDMLGVPEATARALQRRQQQQLAALQRSLLPLLTGPEIQAEVIGQTQTVLNSILIRVDVAHIERIRQLPGVKAVRLLRVGEWHTADEVTPDLAPEAPARPIAPAVPIEPVSPAIQ